MRRPSRPLSLRRARRGRAGPDRLRRGELFDSHGEDGVRERQPARHHRAQRLRGRRAQLARRDLEVQRLDDLLALRRGSVPF